MSQLPDPVADLTGADLALYESLVAKRGRVDGMYRALLNHPLLILSVSSVFSVVYYSTYHVWSICRAFFYHRVHRGHRENRK